MRTAIAFGLISALCVPAIAQLDNASAGARPSSIHPNLRIDSTMVLIPVSVTDPLGRYVTDLEKQDFRLFEDKAEQEIAAFSTEDAPLSLCLAFDTSGSMGEKLQKSREAVKQVLKVANPEDEFCLIRFNDRPELVNGFTADTSSILNPLLFTRSKGQTALLDSVYLAMHQMKKARNPRKAVLVVSDGGDNSSRYTLTEVRKAVREGDVQMFAIGVFEAAGSRPTPEEMGGPTLLGDMTRDTGGRSFEVHNVSELPDVAEKIAIALRSQYVLGFSPRNRSRDGKYRRVEVRLAKSQGLGSLKVRFRTGYYAPAQ